MGTKHYAKNWEDLEGEALEFRFEGLETTVASIGRSGQSGKGTPFQEFDGIDSLGARGLVRWFDPGPLSVGDKTEVLEGGLKGPMEVAAGEGSAGLRVTGGSGPPIEPPVEPPPEDLVARVDSIEECLLGLLAVLDEWSGEDGD